MGSQALGPDWIIEPGRGVKDELSPPSKASSSRTRYRTRVVSTSLGWFEHKEQQLYLHAGGAIGADGPTDAVGVERGLGPPAAYQATGSG